MSRGKRLLTLDGAVHAAAAIGLFRARVTGDRCHFRVIHSGTPVFEDRLTGRFEFAQALPFEQGTEVQQLPALT